MKYNFSTAAIRNEIMYFLFSENGMPGMYSISENRISFRDSYGMVAEGQEDSIDEWLVYKNNLIALRMDGKELYIHSLDSTETVTISLQGVNNRSWGNYAYVTIYMDQLLVFCRPNKLLKIDLSKKKSNEDTILFDRDFFFGNRFGHTVILVSEKAEHCSIYDIKTEEIHNIELDGKMETVTNLYIDDRFCYVGDQMGRISIFDHQGLCSLKLVRTVEPISKDGRFVYCKMIVCNDRIIELPSNSCPIYIIKKDDYSKQEYESYPSDIDYLVKGEWSRFYGVCENEHFYICCMRSTNYILLIDKMTGDLAWKKPQLPDEYQKYEALSQYGNFIEYETEGALKGFLDFVVKGKI